MRRESEALQLLTLFALWQSCLENELSSGETSHEMTSKFLESTSKYREEIYSLQILLRRTQAGPGRTGKQEQEEISPNHVQRINLPSVCSAWPCRPGPS